jgi:TonB family protein
MDQPNDKISTLSRTRLESPTWSKEPFDGSGVDVENSPRTVLTKRLPGEASLEKRGHVVEKKQETSFAVRRPVRFLMIPSRILKLGARISYVPREGRRMKPALIKKGTHVQNSVSSESSCDRYGRYTLVYACDVAGGRAASNGCCGNPGKQCALRHPTPEYPRNALNLHIGGDVLVRVQVENGVIMETTAISHSSPPLLADSATRWVANEWKFKPSVSGVFTIPISYKQSA